MLDRTLPIHPAHRALGIVLLAYPVLVALLFADRAWITITFGAAWLIIALWDRGRSRLGWLLLLLPLGIAPLSVFVEQSEQPCAIRPFTDAVRDRAEIERQFPPSRACRVVLADGRVVYDGGGVSRQFVAGFAWWTLALWALLAVRPRWPVRCAIAGATWLPATLVLWS